MTEDIFGAMIRNVKNALKELYNSDELQDIVIEHTWEKVPMDKGFLRASVVKYKQLYRQSSAVDGIHTQVRFRALQVRKDMKNIGASNYSGNSFSRRDLEGGAFNYAHIQEVRQYAHYTTAGTGSHYLEKGLEESIPQLKKKTEETVMEAIKKGK